MIDTITSKKRSGNYTYFFRKECLDDATQGANCEGWKKSGYCNLDSEHFHSMMHYCKKTCGVCNKGKDVNT